MSGIQDLQELLANVQPRLHDGEYVFSTVTVKDANWADWIELEPLGMFRETEGLSLILRRDRADAAGLAYNSVFRLIELTVHSSLEAVGLTAAISTCLAERGISANVVAAYYHDWIFVSVDRAEDAMTAIQSLSTEVGR